MAAIDRNRRWPIHPVQIILIASQLPLYLGALLSDWAYSATYEIQWLNFAAWLVPGALIFTGFAFLWSLIDALRADSPQGASWLLVGLLAVTFVLGFVNALEHAKDGWATMPGALILSIIVLLLAIASAWAGFWLPRAGVRR
jgi:uncharacterized membrane protein